jgi:uncharacterized protein YneF (UPF0154 family)
MNLHFNLTVIIIITFLLNIVCGIYRANAEKFWKKMLFIHLPIPLIAYFRITSGVSWKMIPVLVVVAFSGQFAGGKFFADKKKTE